MRLALFRQRTVWVPTWLGALVLLAIFGGLVSLWWFQAEPFLSSTRRLPAEVLVVEGWIAGNGVGEASTEFRLHDYQYIVATGGFSGKPWDSRRWDYAEEAEEQLLRHIPRDRVIRASVGEAESRRTYAMAVASWRALQLKGIHPKAINVFTSAAHARRSRLVFSKVFGPETEVGVVAWIPPGYEAEPWWHSSERADDLIKETVGYVFELLLNSGRGPGDRR